MKYINPLKEFDPISFITELGKVPDLSLQAKYLYLRLAIYMNEEGDCIPLQRTLAEDLSTNVSNIKRYIKELKDKGMIDVEKCYGETEYVYQVCKDKLIKEKD